MSDLVGNPKDRFSQNEAHISHFKAIAGLIHFREIASAIKLLLDAVNRVINEVPTADNGSKQVSPLILLHTLNHLDWGSTFPTHGLH